MNKSVSIKLRLKLFDSVVTPTALFGLSTLPMTTGQLQQLDATQRRMLRSIVGWVRLAEDDWAATMRRVNAKLERALAEYPLSSWTDALARRQFRVAGRFAGKPGAWPLKAAQWDPAAMNDVWYQFVPHRSPGRPRQKWDDHLRNFSSRHFHSESWGDFARSLPQWLAKEREFLSEFM